MLGLIVGLPGKVGTKDGTSVSDSVEVPLGQPGMMDLWSWPPRSALWEGEIGGSCQDRERLHSSKERRAELGVEGTDATPGDASTQGAARGKGGFQRVREAVFKKKTQKGNDGVDYFKQMALVNGVKCYRLNKLDKG